MKTTANVANNSIGENLSTQNLENEIWKPVKGFEGFYEVSNLGNIKSLPRNGTIKKDKILIGGIDNGGYRIFNLSKNGNNLTKTAHRLVAIAFIHNTDNKKQVNHINGIKTDNRVENLEWNTMDENMQHAYKTGLNKSNFTDRRLFGKENPNSKIVICTYESGDTSKYNSLTEASESEGVSVTSIANNLKGLSKFCGNKLKFRYA